MIDPQRLGVSYLAEASVVTDPYGENLGKNLVRIRAEAAAVFHVRSAAAAYVIA